MWLTAPHLLLVVPVVFVAAWVLARKSMNRSAAESTTTQEQ